MWLVYFASIDLADPELASQKLTYKSDDAAELESKMLLEKTKMVKVFQADLKSSK